jgi:hypothetical protein
MNRSGFIAPTRYSARVTEGLKIDPVTLKKTLAIANRENPKANEM